MSRGAERTVEASSSRTRPRSPEAFDRNVRQKSDRRYPVPQFNRSQDNETRRDEELDTALAHIIYDSSDHPLYKRHVSYALRHMSRKLPEAFKQPLNTLQSISSKGNAASEAKRAAAKQLLTEQWLSELLEQVGEIVDATDQEGVVVGKDLGRHRLQLKVVPIVPVDDAQTMVSEGSRVPGDGREEVEDEDEQCENRDAIQEDSEDEHMEEDGDEAGSLEGTNDTENSDRSGTEASSDDGRKGESDGQSENGNGDEQTRIGSQEESMSNTDNEQDSGVDVPPRLPPHQPGKSQVFVCRRVPNDAKFDELLDRLALKVSRDSEMGEARCYVLKSRRSVEPVKSAWMVMILDRLVTKKIFPVKYRRQSLSFKAYPGGKKGCEWYGRGHLLAHCPKLALLYPSQSTQHKATFMSKRPRLLAGFRY